jgi:dihydrofolate reductase
MAIICSISVSLDGFTAGPKQSLENPIGEGGMRLHEWMFQTASWREMHGEKGGQRTEDSDMIDEFSRNVGAYIMGRKMFGGGDGKWDMSWKGWWGDDPPYHTPVFVLTHHPRESLPMRGGTTFHFVSDGIDSVLQQARQAAGDKDIAIAGGASTVQQFIRAGKLDQLHLHVVPVILGDGERLLKNVGEPKFEIEMVTASPTVTHIKYRITR